MKLTQRWARSLAFAAFGLATFLPLGAAELPLAKPEQVGLSSVRLQLLADRLKADIAAKKMPGAVLLIARHGKVAYFESMASSNPRATHKCATTPSSAFTR